MSKQKILLTGSCSFIFSTFVDLFIPKLQNKYDFVSVDKCVKPINLRNIPTNHKFYLADIADEKVMENIFSIERPNIVINAAAESFVDSAIEDSTPFIHSNVVGCQNLINKSLKYNVEKFLQFSTDEVLGQLDSKDDLGWTEEASPTPRNPYAASKYCAEVLVQSAHKTHGLQYLITRSCNVYGKNQNKQNLVPTIINCILHNKSVPIFGTGQNMREWIFVEDCLSAMMTILEKGKINEIYNIGSDFECSNLDMVKEISKRLGHGEELITFIENGRKCDDKRYFLNCNKLKKLGWSTDYSFSEGMNKTVNWYKENLTHFLMK